MADYKSETLKTYDTYGPMFDEKFAEHLYNSSVLDRANGFVDSLSGKKVVDLGCGTGNHSEYFRSKGLDVLCVDISDRMLDICRQKGLATLKADLEDLKLPEQYDGIWAYASLLHLKKKDFPQVIERITGCVKPGGLLGLALKQGEGEGYETNYKYPDTQRWFSYYTHEEVMNAVGNSFDLVFHNAVPVKKFVFMHHLFKKKP